MPDTFRFSVSRVKDGDTVVVEGKNGDTITVRVWGIDAPESSQPYGPAATDVARQIVGGETVTVEVMDEGPYGRIIGRVQKGGTDLAASLALSGCAWHSRRYPTSRQIREAEQKARQEARGLWAQENPVPPWKHRKGQQPAQTGGGKHTAGTVLFIVIVVTILFLISLAGG
ncbi:endonuclease YncB(thermonuclease family) [Salinibacter ruber]|uniref:Endonuclease YncB(Thermonuclease family) n=1 Tax=Salinibacter ruber TaxID=146919 RepID=A0AAW5PC76_9BACT|nr:thermonuclease family protein [Salinibacter ruber]MCS3665772.1 endonuclease YncB(thermonuclease family) [Salinibacter ruber]MCS4159545.1 endonuclease YncB(thermonuclease family) [Salinibacter ruber]MCS4223711.1 endonuclease YncB(thermonuclease family) [Salinibacter ruber]